MTDASPPVDLTVLPELTGCEIEMLGEFLQDFQAIATEAAGELRQALAAGQAASLCHTAHKLKSSARYIGALALGECSQALEHCAEAGDLPGCGPQVQRWLDEWARVDAFLTRHLADHPA
jgi:HPt (histidine-containing phosphotransfer) domain-containing protein